jgi:hypothetical protein
MHHGCVIDVGQYKKLYHKLYITHLMHFFFLLNN